MKRGEPLVTFGVPVYNGERHLVECLASLLNQTYRNIEVTICDNASHDATQAICERFAAADSRVRYYRNPANIGQFPNFNRTLSLARGDYFTWACGDDIRPPGMTQACVAALESNPNAVLAHGPILVQPKGASEPVMVANRVDLRSPDASLRVKRFTHGIASNAMVYGLYRRSALNKAVFGDHLAQDYLLSLQMCMLGPIEYVEEPLIHYRERRTAPTKNRMYIEVPVTLGGLLKEGPQRRRKCWTTLLLGCWYGLRLKGVPRRTQLSGIAAHVRHFARANASRLVKEIVFVAFEPLSRLLYWAWIKCKRHAWADPLARAARAWVPSSAPRRAA